MCGLAGWVSFECDLSKCKDAVGRMGDTMACRGPDASGVWGDTHAVVAHRRLSIIDHDGGRQPMVAEDDSGVLAVLAYTGEIYNFCELRETLQSLGHEFKTASDTEVVLRAYLEWGANLGEHLNGMYAFAIWDPHIEELMLVRDRMGVKPLYYYPTDDGVLFGSEPKAILEHPASEAVVDREGLCEIFGMVKTPGHAVFRGMYEVKPGSLVRFSQAGATTTQYWQIEAKEHTDDLGVTIQTVKTLLEDIVDRQMVADVPVGVLLSGGLDSSAITAIAARGRAKDGIEQPLQAFSVDFSGHAERFRANVQWTDPDTPFAVEVAKHVGAEHINIMLDSDAVLDARVRSAALRAQDLPVSTGDMEYSLYLLCRELREHVKVALSGEAADELFGGYTWFHDDESINADTFPWHTPFKKAGGIDALRVVGIWDRLKLTDYISQRYREALAEVPKKPGETGVELRMRELTYLNLTRWRNFLLDRKDRMSMAVGLEVRVPFCDHRLVEYVFNAPWSMKKFDGREKSLLRAAMNGLLPESVLQRMKNPYPSTQDEKYELALRDRVEELLEDGAPVQQLVPAAAIRTLLEAPVGTYGIGGPWGARAVLERLVEFNVWVTEYGVRVDL